MLWKESRKLSGEMLLNKRKKNGVKVSPESSANRPSNNWAQYDKFSYPFKKFYSLFPHPLLKLKPETGYFLSGARSLTVAVIIWFHKGSDYPLPSQEKKGEPFFLLND